MDVWVASPSALHSLFGDFVGIDLSRESVPDATTLLKFRRLLLDNHLTEHGLLMRAGTIVDATIIAAPSSTKNAGNISWERGHDGVEDRSVAPTKPIESKPSEKSATGSLSDIAVRDQMNAAALAHFAATVSGTLSRAHAYQGPVLIAYREPA